MVSDVSLAPACVSIIRGYTPNEPMLALTLFKALSEHNGSLYTQLARTFLGKRLFWYLRVLHK